MAAKSIILAFAGTASAILLGYCVYFDHKRRTDPEYRRKLHNRREEAKMKELLESETAFNGYPCTCGCCCQCDHMDDLMGMGMGMGMDMGMKVSGKPVSSDQAALGHYFFNEINQGDYLIHHGHLDEGLNHMANAIELCAQPEALLQMMQASLPKEIFQPLVQKLQEHARHRGSESSESSEMLTNDEDIQGTSLPISLLHTQ